MGTNGLPVTQTRKKCPDAPTKAQYLSTDAAWTAANKRSVEAGLDIIAYACPGCGYFHLSRKVKGSDVVVAAPIGITTGALRKKSQSLHPLPERKEIPVEGPIVPANPDARRKVLGEYLGDKDAVSTEEILSLLGCSRHSMSKYMSEAGWRSERGPGARWRPRATAEPVRALKPVQSTELDAAILRHPAAQSLQHRPDSWVIEQFPADVSVRTFMQTLSLAGLTVEVRAWKTR
jgi:hypothetical protein